MSRTQNEDTPPFTRPLVYSTVIKFPQQPLPFSQWLKSKQKAKIKKNHSFSLYSNFNLASSSCPSCSLSLSPLCPRFSILPFSLVFPYPLSPPSPLRVLACSGQAAWQLLHLKNINQCCCGDQIRLPSFIFCPSFPFHRLGLACCCSWSNHEPELVCCSKV